jgi:hypothetical protein
MKQSSTHDLVNALNILSAELDTQDGIPNALCAEAAGRLLELVQLTSDLTAHIISVTVSWLASSPHEDPKARATLVRIPPLK